MWYEPEELLVSLHELIKKNVIEIKKYTAISGINIKIIETYSLYVYYSIAWCQFYDRDGGC